MRRRSLAVAALAIFPLTAPTAMLLVLGLAKLGGAEGSLPSPNNS